MASPMKDASNISSLSNNQRLPQLQGYTVNRLQRNVLDRKGSNDSNPNVFMQKAQEMVHSFHEDNELSRSILSAKRESLFGVAGDTVNWQEAINRKDLQQSDHGKFRTQASQNEVTDFL